MKKLKSGKAERLKFGKAEPSADGVKQFAARGHGAAGDPPTGVGREPGCLMKHPRAASPSPEAKAKWSVFSDSVGSECWDRWYEWPPKTVDELAGMIGIRSDLAETVAVCGPAVPSPYVFTPESRLRHLGEHLARALRMCAGLTPAAATAKHEALLAWEEERYGKLRAEGLKPEEDA
jgi:hypothetical protein